MALLSQKHIALIGALAGGWYISPGGFNLYQVRSGDTLPGLAGRYLGGADRWQDIWSIQSSSWRSDHGNSPSNLRVGDQLLMPQEAVDAAKDMGDASGGSGAAPSKASSGKTLDNGTDVLVPHGSGGGGDVLVLPKPAAPAKPSTPVTPLPPPAPSSGGMSLAAKIAIGAVSVAAAGGAVAYGVHHFKRSRHSNPKPRPRRLYEILVRKNGVRYALVRATSAQRAITRAVAAGRASGDRIQARSLRAAVV